MFFLNRLVYNGKISGCCRFRKNNYKITSGKN